MDAVVPAAIQRDLQRLAFAAVVNSLVNDLIMPLIAMIVFTIGCFATLLFLSAFSVVTLAMPVGATKLYLFGISVDQHIANAIGVPMASWGAETYGKPCSWACRR